ncbi:MAG: hypothetical protein JSS49_17590 [Planctomycetes bacterium]|nr:hypothetical protein [Planctomycetota bacterium]
MAVNRLSEYERSVLGNLLVGNMAIDDVAETLHADQFCCDVHSMIYTAILKLNELGTRVDAVTLAEELDERNQLEDVGGVRYILELLQAVI